MELVIICSLVAGAAVAGIAFAAWRVKGKRTFMQSVMAVVRGGGGPGEER